MEPHFLASIQDMEAHTAGYDFQSGKSDAIEKDAHNKLTLELVKVDKRGGFFSQDDMVAAIEVLMKKDEAVETALKAIAVQKAAARQAAAPQDNAVTAQQVAYNIRAWLSIIRRRFYEG